jgi:hypothetical protein
MPRANINRRSTLEAVYSADIFASDAAQNGRVPNTMLCGVRILSAPDAAGDFEFERATQQVGEAVSESFLTPHRRDDRTVDAGRDSPTPISAEPGPQSGYTAFLDDIVAAAQRFGFKPADSPGRNEPRLRGLRQ